MVHILNFFCAIERLPRRFKVAVGRMIIFVLVSSAIMSAMDLIQQVAQFEWFWKAKAVAWIIYLAVAGIGLWRIYVKWNNGDYHFDEY